MTQQNVRSKFISRLRKEPYLLVPSIYAWLNGWWYRIKYLFLFRRFSAGKYFRVYGRLIVTGPGRVTFGQDCLVISNAIKPVCIRTLNPDAEVILGDSVGLNGTSIQCREKLIIGSLSNIADAYITDTAAHTIKKHRRTETVNEAVSAPVVIGRNVWISVQVVILHGVEIGDNTVVGACSLVRENIRGDVLVAGNPLKVIREIDEH